MGNDLLYPRDTLKVSNMHFYPYFYGPLFDSVINYLDYLLKKKKTDKLMNVYRDDTQFSVIHQLLLVLSPRSIDLIPTEFRDLYREKLASISPLNFQTAERPGRHFGGQQGSEIYPAYQSFFGFDVDGRKRIK